MPPNRQSRIGAPGHLSGQAASRAACPQGTQLCDHVEEVRHQVPLTGDHGLPRGRAGEAVRTHDSQEKSHVAALQVMVQRPRAYQETALCPGLPWPRTFLRGMSVPVPHTQCTKEKGLTRNFVTRTELGDRGKTRREVESSFL